MEAKYLITALRTGKGRQGWACWRATNKMTNRALYQDWAPKRHTSAWLVRSSVLSHKLTLNG